MDDGTIVSIHAGFPNAAEDSTMPVLDLNRLLIAHRVGTFHMRISGRQWKRYGIQDGDIALVDRVLEPRKTDLVVWINDAELAVSFRADLPAGTECWGVVTAIIHRYREISA
jgi:DNA polymerase V